MFGNADPTLPSPCENQIETVKLRRGYRSDLTTEPMKVSLNYRTGSGSDLAVAVPLPQFESVATARSLPLPVL